MAFDRIFSIKGLISIMIIIFMVPVVFCQGLEPKRDGEKWGFVNSKGEWIIKAKYDEVKEFKEDYAAVKSKGKWGFIFESGKWAIKPLFSEVTNFSNGKAGVIWLKKSNGLWGFVNREGEMIISPAFEKVKLFKKEECEVRLPGMLPHQFILINAEGEQITPPYTKREKFGDYYHITTQKENKQKLFCYVDEKGSLVAPWSLDDYVFGEKQQIIRVTGKDETPDEILTSDESHFLFAFIDENGERISHWYEEIREFYLGFSIVRRNHRYCFIDAEYKEVTPLRYMEIRRLKEGYCVAQVSEESFVLTDFKGEQISKEYHGFDIFDENYLLGYAMEDFQGNRRYKQALFDFDGTQKSGWYTKIYPKNSSFYRVLDGEYIGKDDDLKFVTYYNYIVDSTGEVLSDWRKTHQILFDIPSSKYKDSVYQFMHQPNSNFYIEESFFESTFILDFEMTDQNTLLFNGGDFYDGMAMISKLNSNDTIVKEVNGVTFRFPDVSYGFIDWNGDVRLPCKLEYASSMTNGKSVFRKGDVYGVINYKGKVSVSPKFELIGNFGNNLAPCYKDSVWSYINYLGKEILAPKYDDVRPFKYGYAAVKMGKKWGLIDTRGNEILPFKYRKPPEMVNWNKVKVLIDGVGYDIISI